jgi:hypothetical protein
VRDGLAYERVGIRHSAAILAPSTPSGWLYDPETPVESTLDDFGKALRQWARPLTPEEKAVVRNRLLAGVKS